MVVDVRIKPGTEEELTRAYAALRERVEQEDELISHQLCQSGDEPERWLVLSEWETAEASARWDASEEHARLLAPMRACFAGAARARFDVRDGVDAAARVRR
jgi:heme-degrading monooxygenase HmoA